MNKQKSQKLFVILVVVIVAGVTIYKLARHNNPVLKQPSNAQSVTPTISSAVQDGNNDYQAGNEVDDAKFFLNYPKGWQISVQKDNSIKQFKRFNIYVIPPGVVLNQGQNFWGGFIVDAYPPQTSIENWFSNFLNTSINGMNNYMNNRSYYTYTTKQIGNKTAYHIQSSSKAPQLVQEGFVPRDVILGKYYAYQIGFFQNGEMDFSTRIINELFPTLNFQ